MDWFSSSALIFFAIRENTFSEPPGAGAETETAEVAAAAAADLSLSFSPGGRSAAAASSRGGSVGVSVGTSVGISVGASAGVFVGVFVGVSVGVSFGVSVGVSVGVSAPFVSASDSDAFAAASSARAPSDSLVAASASFDSLSSPTTPFTHCFHPPDSGFASTVGEGGFEDVASPAARSTGSTKDASAAATPSFAVVSVEFAVDVFLGTLSAASVGYVGLPSEAASVAESVDVVASSLAVVGDVAPGLVRIGGVARIVRARRG